MHKQATASNIARAEHQNHGLPRKTSSEDEHRIECTEDQNHSTRSILKGSC